jgi:hypothetical protein
MKRSTLPFQRGVKGGITIWRAPVVASTRSKSNDFV